MNDNNSQELSFKSSSAILGYLHKFSATEKVIFAILAVAATVTALIMASRANSYFMSLVPAYGGTLTEGIVGLPHTVNPVLAVTDVDKDIASLVYAGLTRYQNGEIIPDLAEEWNISSDGLTYTFTLRQGLRFQNGSPLTADDVVFTINKVKNYVLKSPRAADWANITATTTDAHTVIFNLKQPNSSFMPNTTLGILSKNIWGNVSDDQFIFSEYNIKPIGAGPYKVVSINRDQGGIPTSYHMETWGGYHSKKPYISNINLSFFPDLEHAANAIGSGYVDSLSSIPTDIAAKLASNKGEPYRVISSPMTRVFGVFFNQNKNPILADATLRKSLSMATDRNALISSVMNNYATAITSPFPKSFDITGSTTMITASTTAARDLLLKNGWKINPQGVFEKKANKKSATTTFAFTLYTADSTDLKLAANTLRDQWQKIGANVTVKVLPPTDLYQNIIRTRDYDALLFGEVVSRPNDLYTFWHSSQRNSPGLNIAMYTNSKVDRYLENIRTATNTQYLYNTYNQINQLLEEDVPAIMLYSPNLTYVVPKSLQGIELEIATLPSDRFQNITDWYTETEQVWNFFK